MPIESLDYAKVREAEDRGSELSKVSIIQRGVIAVLTLVLAIIVATYVFYPKPQERPEIYKEEHRPQIHYSLPANWMNDPNGLVFYNGVFHLFYQHNPYGTTWGPMHWGHAVSTDLVYWKNHPIKLYPDKLGSIFSGCVVVDARNVTGLQKDYSLKALIAIYTQHYEAENGDIFERQSLAYSNDMGDTWKLYAHNPIIEDPAYTDFRDPKIVQYKDHYIMALTAGDRILFYKSHNLIKWQKLSEFGLNNGAHGGVWECPDLFTLKLNGKDVWVLLVSINPGGPNRGSATQYFIGDFDGIRFKNANSPEAVLWVDYGPDSYAGLTWFGTPTDTRFFISWMNNWDYSNFVPTSTWRGQMTIPRKLKLITSGNRTYIASHPVSVSENLRSFRIKSFIDDSYTLQATEKVVLASYPSIKSHMFDINLSFDVSGLSESSTIELCFSNKLKEQVCVMYQNESDMYIIDRSRSGKTNFHVDYTKKAAAPRFLSSSEMNWRLVVDVSSIELFADDGLTVMTSLFFPNENLDTISLKLSDYKNNDCSLKIKSVEIYNLKSIWEQL